MKFTLKPLATLLAGVALAAAANADTVSFDYGLPLVQSTTEIRQTGQLGLFNSALGTLTGASLSVTGGARFSFGGTNTGAQDESADITSSTLLRWTTSLASLAPFLTDNIALSATSGLQDYAVGQTLSFGPIGDDETKVDNLSTILAALSAVGGGNFDVSCRSLSGLTVLGGGGNLASTQNTTAGCGASIVYTFDAVTQPPTGVPEPSSLALMGLALAGLAVARRKSKV